MTPSKPVGFGKWFWQLATFALSAVASTQLYAIQQRLSLGALKLKNALYLHLILCTYHIVYKQTG